ncbi:MAG: methyltransferase domain-containing protein [Polyangiaceae bacterium]|nr:methyltransferase domain-containing protein [Polyangiaceae bacterium]
MTQRKRRPEGWIAPGPSPRGDLGKPHLAPNEDEDLSFLSGDFRIFQKKRGHRWSLDDHLTALYAIRAGRSSNQVVRTADIGCGIGSVLMIVAWAFPNATCTGIEAQDVSIAMARRSVEYNGIDDRVRLVHGDLRDEIHRLDAGTFDLVTGTPPYIPIGSGLVSDRTQREPCYFETRGGLEDYCSAASHLLRDGGRFVVCAGVHPADRGDRAASAAKMFVERRIDVVPRDGKPVLFRVFVMKKLIDGPPPPEEFECFVVRDERGELTDDMKEAKRELGMPEMERA